MKLISKLERRYGKYAIAGLIRYVVVLYGLGSLIGMFNPEVLEYLSFNIDEILRGQIWRLITFVIQPVDSSNLFFLFLSLYLYYFIGTSLENAWGTFKFNLYYFSGILLNLIGSVIIYIITKYIVGIDAININISFEYINKAMFLAFAAMYPDLQFLLFFMIPIKAKILGFFYAGIILFELFGLIMLAINGNLIALSIAINIILSLSNFLIFFFFTRNYRRISPRDIKRRRDFKKKMTLVQNIHSNETNTKPISRHKCSICGKTELDDYMLEFRFCSKCDGYYEYCMEHLFSHEHIKNDKDTGVNH